MPEIELWERVKAFLKGCSAGPQVPSFCWQSSGSPTELMADQMEQRIIIVFYLCKARFNRFKVWFPFISDH